MNSCNKCIINVRTSTLILIILVFAGLLGGCGSGGNGVVVASKAKTISNNELHYEITFPATWEVNDAPLTRTIISRSPVTAGAKSFAIVKFTVGEQLLYGIKNAEDEGDAAILKWCDSLVHTGIQKQFSNYEPIEDIETKLGGKDAKKFSFRFNSESANGPILRTDYIMARDKREYSIQILVSKNDSEYYASEIDGIVRSFKFFDIQADPLKAKTASRKDLGFEITYPETWIEKTSPKKNDLWISSPLAAAALSDAMLDIVVDDIADGNSLKEYTDRRLAAFKTQLKNFELGQTEGLIHRGLSMNKITYFMDITTKTRGKGIIYIIIAGKRVYKIYTASNKQDFEIYAKDMDAIVSSFKLIDK